MTNIKFLQEILDTALKSYLNHANFINIQRVII